MDIAEGECSVDGSSAATLSSENLPHSACWSGLACKIGISFLTMTPGDVLYAPL